MIFDKFKSSISWRLYAIFLTIILLMSALGAYVYYFKARDAYIYDQLLSNLSRINRIPQQVVEVVGDVIVYQKAPTEGKESDIRIAIDGLIKAAETAQAQTDTGHQKSIHLIKGLLNILHNFQRISNLTLAQIKAAEYTSKVLENIEYLNIIIDVFGNTVERYVSNELLHAAKIRQDITQWNETFRLLLFFFVALNLFFVLVLGLMVRKSIIRPIQNLEQSVNHLRSNATFSRIEVSTPDEIGSLSMAFNAMADELKASMEELRKSEGKYRRLIEGISERHYIYSLDTEGDFTYLSPSVEKVMGYTPKEMKTHYIEYLTDNPLNREIIDHTKLGIQGIQQPPYEIEIWHKNGSIRQLEIIESPVFDTRGAIVAVEGIGHDITERKQVEMQLEKHRSHLEELVEQRAAEIRAKNKELQTFTYSVSHDLKAPLRGIDGYSRLLLEEYADKLDEEGVKFLENVRKSAGQMNQLIEDLLAYSRMERHGLHAAIIDLTPLFDLLVSERKHDIDSKRIKINVNVPFESVEADADTIRQVIGNYLDNAIKFSNKEGRGLVEIGGDESDSAWTIWVKDNGIGFDPKYHDRIFQIFQRLHRVEDFPGTGVGLAIVRKAVERIGGRIWAESKVGEGAIFYVEIPKRNSEKR